MEGKEVNGCNERDGKGVKGRDADGWMGRDEMSGEVREGKGYEVKGEMGTNGNEWMECERDGSERHGKI